MGRIRMNESHPDIMNAFHQAARRRGLDYYLIGGFAASYWGMPRFTADVDYVVEAESLEKIKATVADLGYALAFLHPKQSFAHFVNNEKSGFRIDFMLVDTITWNKLKKDATTADFGGPEPLPIVGPLHLIAMKLHAAKQPDRTDRYKDLNDVVEILLAQNLTLEDLEKSGILGTHGTERNCEELRRMLESRKQR